MAEEQAAPAPEPKKRRFTEAELKIHCDNIGKAREAIVAACGGPWKKGRAGKTGQIDCPVCGQPAALRFSLAGYNGHVHARCFTPDCVSWME